MPEAEELMQRVPSVMYHGGELIAWTLIVLEAEERLDEQASLLSQRSEQFTPELRAFSKCVSAAFESQKAAMKQEEDFQTHKSAALAHLKKANTLADAIEEASKTWEDRRREQALALHALVDGKSLYFMQERNRADLG